MDDKAESTEKHKVFSRLIDFVNHRGININWGKYCWTDGREYQGKELEGHKDDEFSSTHYHSGLLMGEIGLNFDIDWSEKTSRFSLRFTKYGGIGLSPQPEDVVLSSKNPYFEEKETRPEIPIFQARYGSILPYEFDEARTAMLDFIQRGPELARYFTGMQQESIEQYLALVERFKSFQNIEGVVRIS